MKIKPAGKFAILALFAVIAFFGIKWFKSRPKAVQTTQEVGHISLPDAPEASLSGTAAVKTELPSTTQASNGGLHIDHLEMTWAAQTSFNYANGGEWTTKGSLFDKAGLDVHIIRQDDDSKSQTMMVKWTQFYHDGKTKDGMIVTDMGSQMDSYLKAIAAAVEPLGPEYQPVIFIAWGKSYGEDQIIAKPEIGDQIKNNPQMMRGKVLRGVRLGGDIDIALKYAGDNGVPVNVDEKLYDPNALNLSYSADFLSAVVDYNSGTKETRQIVQNGKTTGRDTSVSFDMVATWTPGDYNAVAGPGAAGGVTLISTHQYASIMPSVGISCRKFLSDNATKIQDLITATVQAGDQIRSFNDIKEYALDLDSKIWKEKDKAFWVKYYNGVQQGQAHLGGSMVYNLKDLSNEFGLQGKSDVYKEVYKTFADIHSKLYPKEFTQILDYSKAVDKSYMMSIVANHPELLEGKALKIDYSSPIETKVASQNVQINFETNSSTIISSSYTLLNKLYSDAIASEGLKVGVYGHTDNTGQADHNQTLSEARADAVKQYFINKGLPSERIESKGYGDQQPIADNSTKVGQAKNRRVEIVLGN